MKIILKTAFALLIALAFSNNSYGQLVNYDNKVDLVLSDGTNLVLYGSDSKPLEYYYLPVNLRLAKRPDGVPEFLFLKYTTDQKADAGGVQGAIMHFLMEWGLTPEQLADAQKKIEELFKKAPVGCITEKTPAGNRFTKQCRTTASCR